MSDPTQDLMIEILRRMQADVSDMKSDLREIRGRVGALERGQAQIEVRLADISGRMDRRDEFIERIMRRLDLAEQSH